MGDIEDDFPWGWFPPLVWHDCGAANPHDRCGGCDECCQMQHEYYRMLEKDRAK